MKKIAKITLALVFILLLIVVLNYFKKTNSKTAIEFKVEAPYYTTIKIKIVATGKLNPEEKIKLKPQVSGIVDKVFIEEGDVVRKGDLIAKIRVVPTAQNLANAKSRINSSRLVFDNTKTLFNRNKALFNKGVISKQDFENSELSLNQAKESLEQAQNDYQIIKHGSLSGSGLANTNIVAQIPGTVLKIPVREGDQVIQSNNFNEGTTIATVADMSAMIFEGKVDETEVRKLEEGSDIKVTLGAIGNKEFPAKLIFVAPEGVEEEGAVQFIIKAKVDVELSTDIRAGYSANAEIELTGKDSILCVKEALIQFNRITNKPFVEIKKDDGTFEKKNVKLGISDGVNIEIISGVIENDKIKVWNRVSNDESVIVR